MSYIYRRFPVVWRRNIIWLRYQYGVVGVPYSDLNYYIDYWNRYYCGGGFWLWFSVMAPVDVSVTGFSKIGNLFNPYMRHVHYIRGCE